MMPAEIARYHVRVFLKSTCNLRCTFCNDGAVREPTRTLSDSALHDTLRAAADVGITAVHYSGGEPTTYDGLVPLVRFAASIGLRRQVMTTNGVGLNPILEDLADAGLTRVNISLHSLSGQRYALITGAPALDRVLAAIDHASALMPPIKLNFVVLRSNVSEVLDMLRFAESRAGRVIPRFIELQYNQPVFFRGDEYFDREHVGREELLALLARHGAYTPDAVEGDNPNCSYYAFECGLKFGIIANHSRGYPCGNCRKVRVSPYGDVGACITAEGINIRGATLEERRAALLATIRHREELDETNPARKHLSHDFGFWRWGEVDARQTVRQHLPFGEHHDPS